jgi:hypothetical protein
MTNTYDTSDQPLGSTSVKVLYNNASNFDDALNGPALEWEDRRGEIRQSWEGIEAAVASFLANSGYQYIGPYATGLTVGAPNQIFLYNGEYWRAAASTSLPYTLTGVPATDIPLFVSVGDAVIRSELAAAGGAKLIGNGIQVVTSFAALRALLKTSPSKFALLSQTGSFYYLDTVDTTTPDDGGLTIVAGDGGRWKLPLGNAVYVSQFESLAQALASSEKSLTFGPGNYSVTASTTWPAGKTYNFEAGALVTVTAGQTLTIRGVVTAPPLQIFAGSVVGIREVWVQWFGQGLTSDDQPACQAAHDCSKDGLASDGTAFAVHLGNTMNLGSTLVLTPTVNFPLRLIGHGSALGCRFVANASFSGASVLSLDGNADNTQAIQAFDIRGFSVAKDPANTTTFAGWQIGTAGKKLSGFKESLIEDVHIEGFSFNWIINDTRLVKFARCSGWSDNVPNSVGCLITTTSAATFTGDLDFDSCQWVAPSGSGKGMSIYNTISGAQIKGIRLNGQIHYHGERYFEIYATNGAVIGDIWLGGGFQCDGVGQNMIWIQAAGAGTQLDNINLSQVYTRGVSAGYRALTIIGDGTALLRNIKVDGHWFANCDSAPAYVQNATAVDFINPQFTDVTDVTGSCILFDNCQRSGVVGGNLSRSGGQVIAYFVTFGAGCNYYRASLNTAGGIVSGLVVRDLAAGANKSIDVGNM